MKEICLKETNILLEKMGLNTYFLLKQYENIIFFLSKVSYLLVKIPLDLHMSEFNL